jgi:hypothetical protein
MSNSKISENAMVLVVAAIVDCLLSDIPALREHVLARVEYLGEAISDAQGRQDIADALAWLRRMPLLPAPE